MANRLNAFEQPHGRSKGRDPRYEPYRVRPVEVGLCGPGGLDSPVLGWTIDERHQRGALVRQEPAVGVATCLELLALLVAWAALTLVGLWTVVSAVVDAVVGSS